MSLIDNIYEGMKDDIEFVGQDEPNKSDSEIVKFFAGQTLFITGVTGYLGKCLLEKLLRSCSDVEHIYVLMREHENQSIEERMEKYFNNVVFKRLREECPNYKSKVTVIKGDLFSENLGISDEDKSTIINNVTVMYHNAANVKFDVKASISLRSNVLGTKKMLDLARECKKLKVFVYVSTAYSHLYMKDIHEEFYPSPVDDLQTVYDAIEADEKTEKGLSETELQALIGKFPNIYPYSKAIAEDLVRQYAKNAKFAHAIYRPSIVISGYKEPLPGWCGNTNGPVLIFLAAALGFIRAVYHSCKPMDFIPSDLAINALLVITRDAYVQWEKNPQPQIYNYGSSTVKPITFVMIRDFFDKVIAPNERSSKAVWLNHPLFIDRLWLFYILHFFLHFLPACLIDFILLVSGKRPRVLAIFWKATQHLDKIDYFGNGNWKIHMPKTLAVIEKLNPADKEIFYCDLRDIDFEDHTRITWRGLKLYILKEEIVNEDARRRYYVLWYLHYGFIALVLFGVAYMMYSLMAMIFSYFI